MMHSAPLEMGEPVDLHEDSDKALHHQLESSWGSTPTLVVDELTDLLVPRQAAFAELGPAFALSSIPKLHSNTDTPVKLYLDFDGHIESQWGGFSNVVTPVYDIDGDATTFSQQELDNIVEVWKRVAEEFAPFHIDVTTEDPGDFTDGVGMRISIGGDGAWTGGYYGGVAYLNTFSWSSISNNAYVFSDNMWSAKHVAEASSHEAGHAFGLYHQSTYDSAGNKVREYNMGNSQWAPHMGVGYSSQVTTWHNGTSSQSSSTYQDDMAILAGSRNGFGYRPDDHGGDAISATSLMTSGANLQNSGLISRNADADWFAFSTFDGNVSFTVQVAEVGANLDAVIELRDADGSLITTVDPSATLGASLSTQLATGSYYLVVRSTGQYGHVGTYTINGTVTLLQNFAFEQSTLVVSGSDADDAFRYLGGSRDRVLLNNQIVDLGNLNTTQIRFDGGAGIDRVHVSDGDAQTTLVNLWSSGGRFQTGNYLIEAYDIDRIVLDGEGGNPAVFINLTSLLPGEIAAMGSSSIRSVTDGGSRGASQLITMEGSSQVRLQATPRVHEFVMERWVEQRDQDAWLTYGAIARPALSSVQPALDRIEASGRIELDEQRNDWEHGPAIDELLSLDFRVV